jgi:hypothetical protein
MNEIRRTLERKTITPLWIVASFVSLTEAVLGIAVIQTQGGIQIALTAFLITFPVLIAGLFFTILYLKPFVFYSPKEFGEQTSVRDYVEAMQRQPVLDNKIYQNIQEAVRDTLMSKELIAELIGVIADGSGKQIEQRVEEILDTASEVAVEKIREVGFVTIDATALLTFSGSIWNEPYDPKMLVAGFLHGLYFSLSPVVSAYSYGEEWVLKDKETGKIFNDIGRLGTGTSEDKRSLAEVGIRSGMILQVVRPSEQRVVASKGSVTAD